MGLAYRMLGSASDAEDAVQDTFLKWEAVDRSMIRKPEAWLTTACTNRCLDLLKSAHKKRVEYVGPWIPEPLQTQTVNGPESALERAESLTTAFLLLLERLTPKERAAYLLQHVFGHSSEDVAGMLRLQPAACRQLVSRAARHLQDGRARSAPSPEQKDRFLSAFQSALASGETAGLADLLSETVQLRSDGGGKIPANSRIFEGRQPVAKFLIKILGRLWTGAELVFDEVNGLPGLSIYDGPRLDTVVSVSFAQDGEVDQVFVIRNPDKLRHMSYAVKHDLATGGLEI